jgi:glycosyltransferase involved in cell wall biosynthesis
MRTIIISVIPHVSGPYSFFLNLKNNIQRYGWNVVGLTLNNKFKADGFLNIESKGQDDINEELLRLLEIHKVHVFMPISYNEFHNAVPFVAHATKIFKRATVLDYNVLLKNKDFVTTFIATTPRQYFDLIKLGIAEVKLTLIPNPTVLYEIREQEHTDIRLGFIGRLSHPSKGVMFIPRIFSSIRKKHKNVKLKYLGGGQDLKALKMMHLFDRLANRVEFTGRFQIDDIPRLASDIDIFLMPSKSEGFGIALIEAMSMGIVPIVSRIEGVTDWIVEDGVSGFVVDRNEKSFVEKALYLIENPEERMAMAQRARQRVAEMFTVEIVSKRYAELLDKVLGLPDIDPSHLTPEKLEPVHTAKAKRMKMRWVPDFVKDIYKIITIKRTRF